ncbi:MULTISPECIES: hypothetical protein [unclassified Alteromonas]|uniref:hypothetical protein n=1 Tax=unclassified Alteromonas TaxID=2614992 RepID=UPI000509CE3B|nr:MULTISPECIES: hypothetical protein [unclassified Alteromonas]
MFNFKYFLIGLVFTLPLNATASIIYAENFSFGHKTLIDAGWSDSDNSNGLEYYQASGSGARGMNGFYDHDNNPLTPDVNILGALEVNDDAGSVTLLSEIFTVNQEVNYWETGKLTFYSGIRQNNADGAFVELTNLTRNMSLTGQLIPEFNGRTWQFNSFEFGWGQTQLGDDLQLTFQGGGSSSANGLQVADITITRVPAPSSFTIFAFCFVALYLRVKK